MIKVFSGEANLFLAYSVRFEVCACIPVLSVGDSESS